MDAEERGRKKKRGKEATIYPKLFFPPLLCKYRKRGREELLCPIAISATTLKWAGRKRRG